MPVAGPKDVLHSPRGDGSPQQRAAAQVSDLKVELARRDAEVEYLEGQLAEAVAANRPHLRPKPDESPHQVCFTHSHPPMFFGESSNNASTELDS